jgi:transcription elongation factor SPT6
MSFLDPVKQFGPGQEGRDDEMPHGVQEDQEIGIAGSDADNGEPVMVSDDSSEEPEEDEEEERRVREGFIADDDEDDGDDGSNEEAAQRRRRKKRRRRNRGCLWHCISCRHR